MNDKQKFIEGLYKAWRDEVRSARNYRSLADREINKEKKTILVRMAEAEERHATTWAARLRERYDITRGQLRLPGHVCQPSRRQLGRMVHNKIQFTGALLDWHSPSWPRQAPEPERTACLRVHGGKGARSAH